MPAGVPEMDQMIGNSKKSVRTKKVKDTLIIKLDREKPDLEKLGICAEVIRKGGLVCFPTETVYGLGASAFDPLAVKKIFEAKGRPADNPLIVHIDDGEKLNLVCSGGGEQRKRIKLLAEEFWPGPLTMIADRDPAVPDEVSCGLPTVGIRMPDNRIARELIRLSGVPIAAPSANLSGKPSPSAAEHVIADLFGRVDVIIDGGDCDVGVESTVLDITGKVPAILRPGAVTLEDVVRVLGKGELPDWKKAPAKGERPRSPGMKYTHYSPDAEVRLYDGEDVAAVRGRIAKDAEKLADSGKKVGILTTDEGIGSYDQERFTVISAGSRSDLLTVAHSLYGALRDFDRAGTDVVLAEAYPQNGVGNAVMNRLYRAAGGCVINAGAEKN